MKKEEPHRKCIVSGEILTKDKLLRFTITPDKIVVPDFKKRLPGIGIWVKSSRAALETAVKKNLFSKAARLPAKVDETLVETTEKLLRKKGLEMLSLSRKAGDLVTGFEKVGEAVKKDKVAFLIQAQDAGADGRQKMKQIARGLEIFSLYTVEELDRALDKVNTVHAALLKSDMAKAVYQEFKRFEGFLDLDKTDVMEIRK